MMMDGNKKEYSLNFWEGAKADIESLDGSQLIFLRKGLKRIKKMGLLCRQPLQGELEEYRKLKNRKMGLRIIFGQDPETAEINIIDIVAVGKRKNFEVNESAKDRIKNK